MQKKCGAKTRAGQPCKNWPIKNKKRCRMHGGKSPGPPKGNRNALKHGAYSRSICDSEKGIYVEIKVGNLDDEIRIIKLQLARAAEALKEIEIEIEGIDVEETPGMMPANICRKYETLMTLCNRLSGRVGDLVSIRGELMRKKS